MARDKGANVLVRQLLCRLQLTLGQGPGNVPPFLLRQRQQDETVEAKAVPFFKESPPGWAVSRGAALTYA